MNFNLIFSALSAFSFIIEFAVNSDERQDYFLFVGNITSAHLFRENTTLYLHLTRDHGKMFSLYNTTIKKNGFQFSWNGFTVDGEEMVLQRSIGEMGQMEFEHFTFISPIVNIFDIECAVETIYHNANIVNYWYFFLMMIAVAIGFDSKSRAMNIIRHFLIKREGNCAAMDSGYISQEVEEEENVSV